MKMGSMYFGPFELSTESSELRKHGQRLKLSGQAIDVLLLLVSNAGKLVTREELQRKLWPGDSFGDFEHGLNAAVNRLRETLGDSATDPTYIETIPRRGYRFIARVDLVPITTDPTVPDKSAEAVRTRRARSPPRVVANQCDMSNNCADGSVGVLLGNGDGTFQPVVNYGSGGSGVWALAVADVNGDGTPDLLDASFFFNMLGVLLGNGDGTFQEVTTYGSGGVGPFSVAVADLNGDGRLDVAVANFCGGNGVNCLPGKLGVLLNRTADTTPPMITLSATPKILWPPNGKMVLVTVSGTITDTGSGVNSNSAAYSVQDEYGKLQPTGAIPLSVGGNYSFNILLQASRRGADVDGRRYTVTVRAKDNAGNRGSKTTAVTVPHGQGD